jgi:GTPase
MLRDEAEVQIRSGKGGPGAVSFRREKYAPEGGPDGGDGGKGGDVVFEATIHLNTLSPFIRRRHWFADNGAPGGATNCSGKSGEDLVVKVPCGTIIRHAETGEILADLTKDGQRVVLAAGGRGGGGNSRYKSATNQTPRQAGKGRPGVELPIKLELKLIADVGIIGFPNAGKSTLLSRLSAARPKIAPYPFTTIEPQLGVIERDDRSVVLADIPGLIEGAARGVGLGHKFLRHVERCPLLLHLVDASEGDVDALIARIGALNHELREFSADLAGKPQWIVLTKADAREDIDDVRHALSPRIGQEVLAISGVSGYGLPELEARLLRLHSEVRP